MTFLRSLLILVLAAWISLSSAVQAQEAGQPNYTAWERLAGQAEQILQSGQANEARLDDIRTELVRWRESFAQAQGTNATRIATMRDQIAALGPAPAEGETESEDLAARRADLNRELSELQAPGLNAVEAFGRADSIIQQIDRTQRERQTNALLRPAPTPLNPANWAMAFQDGFALVGDLRSELRQRWQAQGGWSGARDWGYTVTGLALVALFLLTVGRRWIDSVPSRLSARTGERVRAVVVFAVSLGQIVVPLFGVLLAVGAVLTTGLAGEWGRPILLALPGAALMFYGGLWLANRLFPQADDEGVTPLPMPPHKFRKARLALSGLAAVTAFHHVLAQAILPLSGFGASPADDLRVPMNISDGSAAVWHLPLIALAALLLYRLGHILRKLPEYDNSENTPYRLRLAAGLGIFSRLVAVAALALAVLGYTALVNALIWPWILTLALIGLLALLQEFIADLYAMAKGGDAAARDALMPMLIGLLLTLMSLPLFLLIWGARPNELGEYWLQLRQGVSIAGITLSPAGILTFVVVFFIGYSVTRFVQGGLRSSILPRTRIDAGGQKAIVAGVGYMGIILAILLAVTNAGLDLSSFAFIAGALSVGIGFGLQNIVSNFVAGIILLIERPIAEGDWIEVGGQHGTVTRISVRSTHVQTFDRTELVVPNSDFVQQTVTNWTRHNLSGRIIVPVKVMPDSDTRLVSQILLEIAEDQPTVVINPPPQAPFRRIAQDGYEFEIRAILSDINGMIGVTSDINHQIVTRFAQEGIRIAPVHSEIILRNPGDPAPLAADDKAAADAALPGGAKGAAPDEPTPRA